MKYTKLEKIWIALTIICMICTIIFGVMAANYGYTYWYFLTTVIIGVVMSLVLMGLNLHYESNKY